MAIIPLSPPPLHRIFFTEAWTVVSIVSRLLMHLFVRYSTREKISRLSHVSLYCKLLRGKRSHYFC